MRPVATTSVWFWRVSSVVWFSVAVGLIVWNGADRVPADPCVPLAIIPAAISAGTTLPPRLQVVSFNLHSGKGDGDVVDLQRSAEVIGPCDLAGLYEVRRTVGETFDNQAADVGQSLHLGSVFAATERHWWQDHFGNALLFRVAPMAVQRIPLPGTRGKAFRNALLAQFSWDGETLQVLAVHVDREQDREAQLAQLVTLFQGLAEPAIFMGDLNSDPSDPRISELLTDPEVGCPLKTMFGEQLPPENIDWMFTRGLTTIAVELTENSASDHPVLRATLERQRPPATAIQDLPATP